jgi:hypothetical protein
MDNLSSLSICSIPAIVAAFSLAIAVLAIALSYRQRQVMLERWDQLAMRTGLILERGSWLVKPRVTGQYRRRGLDLTTYTRSHGKSSTTYTLITLQISNNRGGITLSPSGALAGAITKALGMQDIQIGNEEFDKRFTVKSQPPEFAIDILGSDPMLCDSITRLKTGWFELKIEGVLLAYREVGRETNPDRLESMFNTLSDLADKVDPRGKGAF